MANNRITELKEQEFNMQYQQLAFNHQQRQEELQAAHISQYQQFNSHWDEMITKIQQEDEQELEETENRHIAELQENRSSLEENLPLEFKQSTELLNQRKIQTNLAK